MDMLHVADDGTETWMRVSAVPFHDPTGDVQAAIAVVQDIDRERRAVEAARVSEDALRKSEALAAQRLEELEAIYRDAPVGLAVIDPELRFRHVNERLAAMNGIPAADHIGRSVAEIVPHIASDIAAIAGRVIETGQPARDLVVSGETALLPGVKRQWVEQWYPLRDASGRIVGINIVVDEVTDRLRAEATLAETQRRLEEALVTARMAYWDWDPATDRTVASDSMAEVCGLLPGQALDSSAFGHAIMHPDDREAHRAKVQAASARGEGWRGEFRIIRPRDGRVVWLEEHATVTRSPDGGAPHVTGMIWDITDRKRGEAAAEHQRLEREREALRRRLASAEEDERRRLSRELHDQLGQHLTALVLGLAESRRLIACGRSADERLAQLEGLAGEMTRDARHLALELRPPQHEDVGLENTLAHPQAPMKVS
jgi:PAS domain S-box-containing protein